MKIVAVLDNTELVELKGALVGMRMGAPEIAVHSSDLEAVQVMYLEGKPNLLVLDLDLPGVIGMETLRAIRQQRDLDSVAVLVLSARDFAVGQKASSNTIFLQKPVPEAGWVGAIRRALAAAAQALPVPEPAPQEPPAEPPKENRKAARKPFEAPCVVVMTTKKMKGVLRDISMTGAKVSLNEPMGAGAILTLIFAVPNTVPLKVVQFKARVVRQTPGGYGIAFWEMDPATRASLHSLTQ